MKILFIYPNAEGYGRVSLGIAVIMSVLETSGHEVALFDSTFLLKTSNSDEVFRQIAKLVVPTDTSKLYSQHSEEDVDEMLREKVRSFAPDLVAVTVVEENYHLADHFLQVVKSLNKNIPTIIGGSTPTIAPEVMIENPLIDYLVQGEGEETMQEFCELMEAGKSLEDVRNLWYKKNGKIFSNPIRPYIDMDTLPIQNLEHWDPGHFVKPYDGRLYKAGSFELSRGCPFKCTFCINEQFHRMLDDAGGYFRTKSISNGIEEIKTLKEKMGLELIVFCDDNFLQMSESRVKEFTKLWVRDVNLPYWINTTVETISYQRLEMLKETGCAGIGLGIESGSEWLRQNVLRKPSTNSRIEKALGMIHEFDIRTTSNCMIGFPGEYEGDIFETIKLFKNTQPKSYDLSFVAPYIGTPIHELASKMGIIEISDRPGFKGMVPKIRYREGPEIENPNISRERLMEIYRDFVDYVEGRLPIPDEFLAPVPGNEGIPRGNMGTDIAKALRIISNNGDTEKDVISIEDEDLVTEQEFNAQVNELKA
jgi:anaerobic magnesium-protoporphyrin IX monomethyl ester cyclase